jgi:hypothetical protein
MKVTYGGLGRQTMNNNVLKMERVETKAPDPETCMGSWWIHIVVRRQEHD